MAPANNAEKINTDTTNIICTWAVYPFLKITEYSIALNNFKKNGNEINKNIIYKLSLKVYYY